MTFWSSSAMLARSSASFAAIGFSPPHHPAAFILALGFEVEHAGFFEFRERRIPEMQMKNFALARQEIVFNVQPVHGFKMAAQHGNGNQVTDCAVSFPPSSSRAALPDAP